MHVEDHPIEYGTFEGVIPSGYGQGIVMLWDQGTWTPESSDVDAALKKGDLKFTLDGFKLKGSWVIVRTGGRWGGSDHRSWLLIKHRDDWAGEVDITEFAPKSVKSGGDFEDILASDNPAIWESHRPAKGGEAGAMLARIVERAAALRATKGTKSTKGTKHEGTQREGTKQERKQHEVTGQAGTTRAQTRGAKKKTPHSTAATSRKKPTVRKSASAKTRKTAARQPRAKRPSNS
jgi:hypothetical protein